MQNYVESFFLDIRRHTSPFKPLCLWYCRKVVCYKPRQLQVTTFTPHRFKFLPGNFLTQCYMASHHPPTKVVCRGNSCVTDAFVCEFWFRPGLRSNQHNLWKEKEFVKSVRWWSLVNRWIMWMIAEVSDGRISSADKVGDTNGDLIIKNQRNRTRIHLKVLNCNICISVRAYLQL